MAIFKKLSVGDIVATSGTRAFRKLTTAEVTPDDPTLPIWNGTDLTGTTWSMPNGGWTAEAGYGEFDVTGKEQILSNTKNFHMLRIGYAAKHIKGEIFIVADNICWDNIMADGEVWHASVDNTKSPIIGYKLEFTFSGGTDVTNPRLIDWLLQNGKLTSHRFDIKGEWLFNETITQLPAEYSNGANGEHFHIAFNNNYENGTYGSMGIFGGTVGGIRKLYYAAFLPIGVYNFDTEKWEGDGLRSVEFYEDSATNDAGEDVTPIFYKWLRANAKKK